MTTIRPAQPPVIPQGIGIPPNFGGIPQGNIPPVGIGLSGLALSGVNPPNIDVRQPFATNAEISLSSLARIFQNTKQLLSPNSASFASKTIIIPSTKEK